MCPSLPLKGRAVGPRAFIFGTMVGLMDERLTARCEAFLSMYIAYISVSKPTPWAVAGLQGQLASKLFSKTEEKNNGPTNGPKILRIVRVMKDSIDLHVGIDK